MNWMRGLADWFTAKSPFREAAKHGHLSPNPTPQSVCSDMETGPEFDLAVASLDDLMTELARRSEAFIFIAADLLGEDKTNLIRVKTWGPGLAQKELADFLAMCYGIGDDNRE